DWSSDVCSSELGVTSSGCASPKGVDTSCQPRCGRCPSPPEALGPGRSADRGPSCDEDGDAAADGVDPCTPLALQSSLHVTQLAAAVGAAQLGPHPAGHVRTAR